MDKEDLKNEIESLIGTLNNQQNLINETEIKEKYEELSELLDDKQCSIKQQTKTYIQEKLGESSNQLTGQSLETGKEIKIVIRRNKQVVLEKGRIQSMTGNSDKNTKVVDEELITNIKQTNKETNDTEADFEIKEVSKEKYLKNSYFVQNSCINRQSCNKPGYLKCHKNVNHNPQFDGFLKDGRAYEVIVHTRHVFELLSLKKNASCNKATTFINHPERRDYIRQRNRVNSIKPKYPPEQPVIEFNFATDVYNDICRNLDQKNKAFINHPGFSEIVYLNEKSSVEMAMEELLKPKPFFHSTAKEKESLECKYIDPVSSKSKPVQDCNSPTVFILDFAVIYPEDKLSTVFLTCQECGKYIETILSDYTSVIMKKELFQCVAQMGINSRKNGVALMGSMEVRDESGEPANRHVIRLNRKGLHEVQGVSFVEGLVGVKPLTGTPLKPSVFIRTRLTYFCSAYQNNIINIIHNKQL